MPATPAQNHSNAMILSNKTPSLDWFVQFGFWDKGGWRERERERERERVKL